MHCLIIIHLPLINHSFRSKYDEKCYPDFIVASYYEDKEKHDKIHLIVEIGNPQMKEAALDMAKKSIQMQLNEYMVCWVQRVSDGQQMCLVWQS